MNLRSRGSSFRLKHKVNMSSKMETKRRLRIDELVAKYRKMDSDGAAPYLKLRNLDMDMISRSFFTSHGKMQEKAAIVAKDYPLVADSLKSIGKDILEHKFTLLGYGPAEFGFPLKWHCDYRSSKEWPADVDFRAMGDKMFDLIVDRKAGFEVKFPWDLSNLMWLPSLSCAYHLTGDRKYIESFNYDISDWITKNPYPLGVNWICPMNIAIRAINMIAGLTSLHPVLERDLIHMTMKSLFSHGVGIMGYLELGKSDRRNNHYLTDLAGLYFLGHFFKDTEEGREWLDFATDELELESEYQFYPDGVNFEESTSYHRLSSEMLLLCATLSKVNGAGFSKGFLKRLHRSLGFTRDIMQESGRIPMFGDNDNGRILQFHGFSKTVSADHRHILATGGEFFNDDCLRYHGRNTAAEAIWLLGNFKSPSSSFEKTGPILKTYPDSGYFIIEDVKSKIVVRNARLSQSCGGGHAHCDQLSFTLSYGMQEIFVDPGTFLYSSSFEERNKFRSVEYHNTIQIGSEPMHEYDRTSFGGLWWMKDHANAETIQCKQNEKSIIFQGKISYPGYEVFRNLEYSHGIFILADSANRISKKSMPERAFSRFMLDPELVPSNAKAGIVSIRNSSQEVCTIEIMSAGCSMEIKNMWVAPEYGTKIQAKQLVFCWLPENGFKINICLNKDN